MPALPFDWSRRRGGGRGWSDKGRGGIGLDEDTFIGDTLTLQAAMAFARQKTAVFRA